MAVLAGGLLVPRDARVAAAESEADLAQSSRLAVINQTTGFWGAGFWSTVVFRFVMDPEGNAYALGENLSHRDGGTGTFNFTGSSDTHFSPIVGLLTDGQNGYIELWAMIDGGSGEGGLEDYWLKGTPDLVGYSVDHLSLVIHDLYLRPEGPGTVLWANVSWEVWGSAAAVAFFPPTDPDGTYLIERNYTHIVVRLASMGNAVLEWQGVNESMNGANRDWERNKTALPNGQYQYRVWAQDLSGAWVSTESRSLIIGVGIWRIEQLAHSGFRPSLAYGPGGIPHTCFYNGNGLSYATWTIRGWESEIVSGGGLHCSLAVDASGRPHMSYESEPGGNSYVMYATSDVVGWSIETVAATGFTTQTSIALDPLDGVPGIAYLDSNAQDLAFASRASGIWLSETADATGETGWSPALALGPDGRPHVAYFDYTTGTVKYAVRNGASWTIRAVGGTGGYFTEQGISIAVDSQGTPHIAFAAFDGVRYGRWDGAGWALETVRPSRAFVVSMAIDAQDNVHLAFDAPGRAFPQRELWYATKRASWELELVSRDATGSGHSLALGPDGLPAIAFESRREPGSIDFAFKSALLTETTPPITTSTVNGTAGRNGWHISAVLVTLSPTDDRSGVVETSFRADDGTWGRYTGPVAVSGEGVHSFEFFSVDRAGNQEAMQDLVISIDTQAPTVDGPDLSLLPVHSPVTLHWGVTDATSGFAESEVSVDGGPYQPLGAQTFAVLSLSDGDHMVAVKVLDAAGHEAVSTARFRVDSNPFSLTGPYAGIPSIALLVVFAEGALIYALSRLRRSRREKPVPESRA